jgi:hypothetical protein
VTLTRFTGLYAKGAGVVLMPGANHFRLSYGQTVAHNEVAIYEGSHKSFTSSSTQRLLEINGEVGDITVDNWHADKLSNEDAPEVGFVVFNNATVNGLKIENIYADGSGSWYRNSCNDKQDNGCATRGLRTTGTANTLSNVTITNSSFTYFLYSIFNFDAGNPTIANWTITNNLFDYSITVDKGSIACMPSASISGFTFSDNTLRRARGGKALNFENAQQADNIVISGNVSTDERFGAAWLTLKNAATKNLTIKGNQWNNLNTTYDDDSLIILPDQGISGVNEISGNSVAIKLAKSRGYNDNFILWSGSRGNDSTASSNMAITNNTLAGFSGSAIQIKGQGITTIRENRFTRTKDATGKNRMKDEEEHSDTTGGFMVQNQTGSNGQIQTVYPTLVNGKPFDTRRGVMPVEVLANPKGNQPAYPITVDWYATQSDDAEIRLGSNIIDSPPGTTAGTGVQLDLDLSAIGTKQNVDIRLQTTDALGRSSQYSRTAKVGDIEIPPETWELTKTAYADAQLSQPIPSDAVQYAGETVYWVYTVDNRTRTAITVDIEDDQKTDGPVCTALKVPARDQNSCTWSQQLPAVNDT